MQNCNCDTCQFNRTIDSIHAMPTETLKSIVDAFRQGKIQDIPNIPLSGIEFVNQAIMELEDRNN